MTKVFAWSAISKSLTAGIHLEQRKEPLSSVALLERYATKYLTAVLLTFASLKAEKSMCYLECLFFAQKQRDP